MAFCLCIYRATSACMHGLCVYLSVSISLMCIYSCRFKFVPEVERVQKYSTQVKVPLHY